MAAAPMHFTYEGFTHRGDTRCFVFRDAGEPGTALVFTIEIDLPLLFRNHISVQEGPGFCLKLLTTAAISGPEFLEKFRQYRVLQEDFRSLLVDRERRAAERACKKAPRRPIRKPSSTSNVLLVKPPTLR